MPYRIGVIGGGPAGVFAAIFASKNPDNEVFLFDKSGVLKTLLPTGGGRCNLANAQKDFKELAKNYPRGEKFLYSVFSQFSTEDTLDFFSSIGIETYTQPDGRIFPISNSSLEVRNALLKMLKKVKIRDEKVVSVEKKGSKFLLKTERNEFLLDSVVISSGGKGRGHAIAKSLGHTITPLKPSLTGLKVEEHYLSVLSGLSLQNIEAKVLAEKTKILFGDLLFTHEGISGPLTFKISSHFAYHDYSSKPLKISFNLVSQSYEDFDEMFLNKLKKESQKNVLNVLSLYVPRSLAQTVISYLKIDPLTKAGQFKKEDRTAIAKMLTDFCVNVSGLAKGEEMVTAGGVELKEVNPKTMESKIVPNLYFCGEILDIDGLTGGFNLQSCWSTGYIAGMSQNSH